MRMSLTDRFGYQQPEGGSQGPAAAVPGEDTRDRIINTYREEIKNHQARDRDFKVLQEVLGDLQRRTRALESEIGNCQRDHEDRIRDQQKTIGHLQNDLEVTKKSIKDRQEEGIQIHD